MPTYYFDLHRDSPSLDADGVELPDEGAALVAAARHLGELLRDDADGLVRAGAWRLEVRDARRSQVFAVEVALRMGGPAAPP
ncbi:DUF6894 family protein [Phenylobacterium terrae]|uniref:DUF6894 family protein n=1 Tax=Phenylobacterium terrae TaxID=2665495 RepID=A0ABW4N6G2_9CAUL